MVNPHDVFTVITQNVVVEIDRSHIAVNDDGIEVEVSQTADGRELVVVQVGRRRLDSRSCGCRCGRVRVNRLCWRRGDTASRIWTGGDTEVERIDQRVVSHIVHANLAGFTEGGGAEEGENQMRVRIHAGSFIRRETFNLSCS
jgi:hypothetical protein